MIIDTEKMKIVETYLSPDRLRVSTVVIIKELNDFGVIFEKRQAIGDAYDSAGSISGNGVSENYCHDQAKQFIEN